MPCYHPLKGFKIGINPATGKDKLRITSYKVDHVELSPDGKYYNILDNCRSPFAKCFNDYVDIPCGRCIGCRLTRAKQWADRASLELQYHESNLFLTLTYNNNSVPSNEVFDKETGEFKFSSLTLKPKDLQDFWKRLRKYCDKHKKKIRYLACGEYGSSTFRPHYHAIVYGLELPDLKLYCKTKNGDYLYESEILDSIWKNGKVWIGEATYESIGYVARYVVKKLYGDEAVLYKDLNIVPEFLTCSRKPGLGFKYYEENKNVLFEQSKYFISSNNGVRSASPSRYFNKLFESDFDSILVEERKNRLKANFESSRDIKLRNTDLDLLDYLEVEEYNKINSVKSLPRNEI